MRNVLICSSRACCSAPGGSLRAVSKSLAAIFSRSCIYPQRFSLCRTHQIREALSVPYRTQRPRRAALRPMPEGFETVTGFQRVRGQMILRTLYRVPPFLDNSRRRPYVGGFLLRRRPSVPRFFFCPRRAPTQNGLRMPMVVRMPETGGP
jgi:hypothetical protein